MKLSTKIILPIILISALLILLNGCLGIVPDESPGYTPGTITGIIAAPCCSTSADSVTEPCCVSPEYWCYYCQGNWLLQDGIGVVLAYGEDVVAATTTNELGEYTFTDVSPGKNYVITAYCPDYDDNRPLVKDVALEVASSFDAKITDLVSTSLGLVVDFLVLYTEWGPEDISLDEVLADRPGFPKFPKFKKLVYEVRRVLEICQNVNTDADVQDALCRAAEEISGLDIGCGPGYTEYIPPPPIITYVLTTAAAPPAGGSVSGAGTYNSGTVVPITASPAIGWSFTGWSGDLGGNTNPTSITMNSNKTVTATFTQDCYTLTVNIVGNGTVAKDPDETCYLSGSVVGLDPQAAAGWTFTGWSGPDSGDLVGTDPADITMDEDKAVTATFEADCYTLTVTIVGSGSVDKELDKTCYPYNEVVTLTPIADPGWTFTGWSGPDSGDLVGTDPADITMDEDKAVTATFTCSTQL